MAALVSAFVMRLGLLAAGSAALVFAALVFVVWPQSVTLERAAGRIVMGDRYRPEELDRLPGADELAVQPLVRASSLRSAAIVALRQTEETIANGLRTDIDRQIEMLRRSLQHALAVGPADPFLWLTLFWQESFIGGSESTRLSMLEMSYRTGPREGWVAVRRSPWTLGLYSRLRPDLQEIATTEFVGLVASRFNEAASILTGPGWSIRDILVPRLAKVDELQRKALARVLYQGGYDVQVPGVDRPDDRPWSR